MNNHPKRKLHLLCVWSGVVFASLVLIGMIFLARLMPPVPPSTPVDDVIAMYREHLTGIRTGMIVLMFAAAFFMPFTAICARFISKIEGSFSVLSIIQVMGGLVNTLLFFYPPLWWLIAIYRIGCNRFNPAGKTLPGLMPA